MITTVSVCTCVRVSCLLTCVPRRRDLDGPRRCQEPRSRRRSPDPRDRTPSPPWPSGLPLSPDPRTYMICTHKRPAFERRGVLHTEGLGRGACGGHYCCRLASLESRLRLQERRKRSAERQRMGCSSSILALWLELPSRRGWCRRLQQYM